MELAVGSLCQWEGARVQWKSRKEGGEGEGRKAGGLRLPFWIIMARPGGALREQVLAPMPACLRPSFHPSFPARAVSTHLLSAVVLQQLRVCLLRIR